MASPPRAGRPRATSRDTIADAACELFLEQGYDQTSIADIARRAGVSRSSFFNYFASKSDILWAGVDARIGRLGADLADAADPAAVREALSAVGIGLQPDSLALAIAHAPAMGLVDQLERDIALRQRQIHTAVAGALGRSGMPALAAEVAAAAHAGAVTAAIAQWARTGAGRAAVAGPLEQALDAAAATLPSSARPTRSS